jgi:AraC-like DNA-binding protein
MPQILKSIIRVLQLDEYSVMKTAGLPADYLLDETRQVKPRELFALERAIERVSGRDDISYKLATFWARTPRPASTLVFARCETLQTGYENLSELKGPGGGAVFRMERRADRFRIEIRPVTAEVVLMQWFVLWVILYLVDLGRIYTGCHIQPLRVGIMSAGRLRKEDVAYLGIVPVEADHAFIEFSNNDVHRPLLMAQAKVQSTDDTQHVSASLPAPRSRIGSQVSKALVEILPSGRCGIGDVSEHLDMTARKLQRLLKAEQISFRTILEQTRRDLAIRYLEEERRPAAEVADLLGYRNLNSFYRAFRGWTGATTKTFRQGASTK